MKPTVYDDIICDDFGEVKLAFNDKFYSIIIGTEYEHVFSVLQFLQRLSNLLGADELVENSLIYIDNIINQLAKYNISPYKEPSIRYEIPAEIFFIAVNNLFSTNFYFSINPELVNIFSDTKVIEKHFILHNNINYPLFNSSLLVDLYSYLLKRATKKQIRDHVEFTIIKKIRNIHNSKNVYIYCTVIDNNKPISKHPITFIVFVNNAAIVAINKDAYSEDDLTRELKTIETLHKNGSLVIAYMLKETNAAIKIPLKRDIQIILYSEYTDTTQEISVCKNNHFQCFASDLITMICFSEYDMYDVSKFISYYLRKKEKIMPFSSISDIFLHGKIQIKNLFKEQI